VVHKVNTKSERAKKLNFICEPKYSTLTSESSRENSDLFTRDPQILKTLKITGLDNMGNADGVVDKYLEGNFCGLI
jgi:hypothetical protein